MRDIQKYIQNIYLDYSNFESSNQIAGSREYISRVHLVFGVHRLPAVYMKARVTHTKLVIVHAHAYMRSVVVFLFSSFFKNV